MESVRKALWFMESRFGGELSLDELSQAAGISRYHFAHVFVSATGQSAMRYIRGRRLSEAARVLANGGPDILNVALDFGYGSHEAFTRAFRDQFGLTPESVRTQRHLDMEPASGPSGARLGRAWHPRAMAVEGRGAFARGTLLIADHGAAAVRAAPFSGGKRKAPKPLERRQ
jgi:AraC-like DNA-binding protein